MAASNTDSPSLSFRVAGSDDIAAIVALVNSAYRGDSSRLGWTTEADLLGGQRTEKAEVQGLIEAQDSIILLGIRGSELIGCLHLAREGSGAYLGMFAIRPGLQGQGIGKQMMQKAETLVRRLWAAQVMRMTVITLRQELIAFYERRGYRRTGELVPFPDSPEFGLPRVAGLQMETLEKPLLASGQAHHLESA